MITATAWEIYRSSVAEWLRELIEDGEISLSDTVWAGQDGSYGVGEPTLEQVDDESILEMSEAGIVSEWLATGE